MAGILEELSELPSWGNARDVETLAKRITRIVFTTPSSADPSLDRLAIPADQAVQCLETMLTEQKERSVNVPTRSHPATGLPRTLFQQPPESSRSDVATSKVTQGASHAAVDEDEVRTQDGMECDSSREDISQEQHKRDDGVTDEIWYQLQEDKRAAEEAERGAMGRQKLLQDEINELNSHGEKARAQAEALKVVQPRSSNEEDELMRRREQARLREIEARTESAKRAAVLEEEKAKRREEARIQQKLQQMGVCVAGFTWIKQSTGYRCAGGSHFISHEQLGI
jgi:hypothetical protein